MMKKSKKKKQKKEKRVSSSSTREDEKKERDRRFESPKRHKHHYHRRHESSDKDEAKRRSATYTPSTRHVSPTKARLTKTDVGQRKSTEKASLTSKGIEKSKTVTSHITHEKEKVTSKIKQKENASQTISCRSSRMCSTTNQSSSKELETQKLVLRRSTPEKPRPKRDHSPSEDHSSQTISCRSSSMCSTTNQSSSKELKTQNQKLVLKRSTPEKARPKRDHSPSEGLKEHRRKLFKRSSSSELHADTKRKDTKKQTSDNLSHVDSQADVHKVVKKTSKEFDMTASNSSHNKPVNEDVKEALPVVKHVAKCRDANEQTSDNLSRVDSQTDVEKEVKKTSKGTFAKTSHDKTVNEDVKESLPEVKHVDSSVKAKILPLFGPRIRFKIPKKGECVKPVNSCSVKAQTNTAFRNLSSCDVRTRCDNLSCLPKTLTASISTNTFVISQDPKQTPLNTLDRVSYSPSVSCPSHTLHLSSAGAVQKGQIDESRHVTTPNNTSCVLNEECNSPSSDHEQRKESNLNTPQKPAETLDCDYEMQLVEELLLARSERRLDVNVVENYGELTCMDIDPPEDGVSATHRQHDKSLLIVLDTNVLLSHLEYVKKIRSNGLGALGFPTLLIPWVVLQELDYLKTGKLSSKVVDKARPAVHYIYSCLKNQEPRLLGQSMQQASQAACRSGVVNNDDKVLQCCLQYQDLYPEGALVLCTDDKNLCSKALLSGVKALSKADLAKEVNENSLAILNHPRAPPVVAPSAGRVEKDQNIIGWPQESHAEKTTWLEKKCDSAVDDRQLSECASVLESCLEGALAEVLKEEMKAAFGDLWTEIVYVKPPWSLEGVLKCVKKHWIAVFGQIIKRSLLSCVEMLSDSLCSNRLLDHTSVLDAVRGATELLSALAGRSQYSGRVDQALSTLHMLQQRLQTPKAPVHGDDEDEDSLMAEIEEDETPPPKANHQEVWVLFESIWNNVCQISSALFSALHYGPGSTEPGLQVTEPPPQEALSCLHRLSAALKQLLEALQRLLSVDSSVQDAQLLLSFIQTSEIAAMEPRFTARDLFDCVSQQEYREKLFVGGAQLCELSANLDLCAAAVSSWT